MQPICSHIYIKYINTAYEDNSEFVNEKPGGVTIQL